MTSELVRIVDAISRDKNIDKENVFVDLEAAMVSAARKTYVEAEEVTVTIDRVTGSIEALADGTPIDMKELGRIAAQTAKQVMIQKIREDERSSIFEEYSQRVGTVVTGTVTRYDGGGLAIINLGRGEGVLPRGEQLPGETYHPGDRARAMILDVREVANQVRIILTRSHPDYIRRLFELEVPEVGERIIEIRALAREPGYRTKVAVSSIDTKVDAVGACVGVRGSRIRNIVEELNGEKIDIVRWNESSQILITNALKPAEVKEVFLCFELGRATVVVADDQLSLAIGKRGQNVRLGARLTGWEIDIRTPADYDKGVDDMQRALKPLEGVDDVLLDKMLAMGIISLADLAEVGQDPLISELEVPEEVAGTIVETAAVEAKRIAEALEAQKKLEAEQAAAQAAREAQEAQMAEAPDEAPAAEGQTAESLEAVASEGKTTEALEAVAAESQPPEALDVTASEGQPPEALEAAVPDEDAAEAESSSSSPSAEVEEPAGELLAEGAESVEGPSVDVAHSDEATPGTDAESVGVDGS